MPHHNLTLLGFSPLKSSSFALFLRPFSLYPILASSPRRPRAAGYRRGDPSPRFPPRRKWSSFEEESRQRKGMSSSSDSFEFNKRRAEGKDKIDKPKKSLKRNTRTLNPTNTIAYVQVFNLYFQSFVVFCSKFETWSLSLSEILDTWNGDGYTGYIAFCVTLLWQTKIHL